MLQILRIGCERVAAMKNEILLTQNELSVRAGTNWYAVQRLVAHGEIKPTARGSRHRMLFAERDVATVRQAVNALKGVAA
jgi:hypothetical protein